jgi:hypothetical protein
MASVRISNEADCKCDCSARIGCSTVAVERDNSNGSIGAASTREAPMASQQPLSSNRTGFIDHSDQAYPGLSHAAIKATRLRSTLMCSKQGNPSESSA